MEKCISIEVNEKSNKTAKNVSAMSSLLKLLQSVDLSDMQGELTMKVDIKIKKIYNPKIDINMTTQEELKT